jgi:hypothetical protein
MAILFLVVVGIVLTLKEVYRLYTGTDYGSMQRKVDDLIQTVLEQEAEIRQLREKLRYRGK